MCTQPLHLLKRGRPNWICALMRDDSPGTIFPKSVRKLGPLFPYQSSGEGMCQSDRTRERDAHNGVALPTSWFKVIEYVFNLTEVPCSERALDRGGATTRQCDYTKWQDQPRDPYLQADADQIWDRIQWFLDRVISVAECCGVKLACHPDDPPVPMLAGETRPLGSTKAFSMTATSIWSQHFTHLKRWAPAAPSCPIIGRRSKGMIRRTRSSVCRVEGRKTTGDSESITVLI